MEKIPEEQQAAWRQRELYDSREIKFYPVEELEEPVRRILEQILPNIESGEYGLIVGDDASGRIPARIFEKFIDEVYDKHGFPHPEVKFIAGSSGLSPFDRFLKQRKVRKHLDKNISGDPQDIRRALIVTDTLVTGSSVRVLTHALKKLGIPFDIATIAFPVFRDIDKDLKDAEDAVGGKIFYGKTGIPYIYNKAPLSGVGKEAHSLLSEPVRKFRTGEAKEEIQEMTNQAREDAFTVADHLIDWYNNKSE